ncbi:polyprenyl diphosphate synthase [Streptomyces sp. CA-249302]|uniref:polyprenyl diphosphate synthase n=1 Tax=Streptomyces sp. CA-249302 TaxID=3240058 RepID=UPI003D8B4B19
MLDETGDVGSGPCGTGFPRHLAVIPDGNRRWAERQGLPLVEAYRAGALRVHDLMTWCEATGIEYVTVWALSRDNLRRAPAAVLDILHTVVDRLEKMAATNRWRIRVIGAPEELPGAEARALRAVEERTGRIPGVTLNTAIAYSGRAELTAAVRDLVRHHPVDTVTSLSPTAAERRLGMCLSTAGQPDVDLVVRTSGEQRMSDFMLWQTAYAELYFCDVPWPDFHRAHFDGALAAYRSRRRRHGI